MTIQTLGLPSKLFVESQRQRRDKHEILTECKAFVPVCARRLVLGSTIARDWPREITRPARDVCGNATRGWPHEITSHAMQTYLLHVKSISYCIKPTYSPLPFITRWENFSRCYDVKILKLSIKSSFFSPYWTPWFLYKQVRKSDEHIMGE